jgi:hypothetical protein
MMMIWSIIKILVVVPTATKKTTTTTFALNAHIGRNSGNAIGMREVYLDWCRAELWQF